MIFKLRGLGDLKQSKIRATQQEIGTANKFILRMLVLEKLYIFYDSFLVRFIISGSQT